MARLSLAFFVLLALLLLPRHVLADAVVNRCTADTEPIAGTAIDLQTAIHRGGHITFNCPAATTITMTMPHSITQNTQIDGGGSITLDARGTVSMFNMSNAQTVLSLTGLTLRRGNPQPVNVGPIALSGGIVSGRGTVQVVNSTIADTSSAINLIDGQVTVSNSEFSNGQGVAIHAPSIDLTATKIHG